MILVDLSLPDFLIYIQHETYLPNPYVCMGGGHYGLWKDMLIGSEMEIRWGCGWIWGLAMGIGTGVHMGI